MQTQARLDGDEWVIDAHKWFTSGANRAAFTTVFCQTEPDALDRWSQFSSILVPTDTPGYEIVRVVPTMGHTGGGHCEIRLTDVRVPKDEPARQARPGLRDRAEAARAGPHLPLHALARSGAARVRADVRAREHALGARLAALREGRDPALRRRVGGGDPGRAADDARRRDGDGRGLRGARRDLADQVLGRARCCTT